MRSIEPGAHRAGRDEQPVEPRLRRVARQLVEQPRQVLADLRVAGEQPVVGVQPRGLRVVVAGADVAVAAQPVGLLAHHERQLAVRLEADDAVDHVHAGLLELAGPGDVVLLVEPRLDLDQRQHLLAGLGGVDQGVDDRGVARRPVQRLLDGQHLRVGRGLLQERLHARCENESYGWCSRMSRSRILANMSAGVALSTSASWRGVDGDEPRELQGGAVQVGDEVEAGRGPAARAAGRPRPRRRRAPG